MKDSGKIYFGVVVNTLDFTYSGKISVRIPSLDDRTYEIIYTSPYFSTNNGGVFAVPEVGAEILLLRLNEDNKFYYLTTIVSYPKTSDTSNLKEWKPIKDKYIYTERKKPQRLTFTDAKGSGLVISNRCLPKYISAKVDLNTAGGKRISLSDSPLSDALIIRNEHGDGIVICSEPNEIHSERSIEIKSKGWQRMVSFQSDISLMVIEGSDITLENFSTGSNTGNGISGAKSGNINLRSHNSDINIVTKGQDGRIFLNTPKARVQIESDGSIMVEATNGIQLKSDGDINMIANGDCNIQAQNIKLEAQVNATVRAPGGVWAESATPIPLTTTGAAQAFLQTTTPSPQVEPIVEKITSKTDYNE